MYTSDNPPTEGISVMGWSKGYKNVFYYLIRKMTTREKFKRRVIELIHWLPYEDAIEKEMLCIWAKYDHSPDWDEIYSSCIKKWDVLKKEWIWEFGEFEGYLVWKKTVYELFGLPITIWRVMQVLWDNYLYHNCWICKVTWYEFSYCCDWLAIKGNWQEATDDDQKNETIEKLYNLIK